MTSLSKTLSPAALRALTAGADALAVLLAAVSSFLLHADGLEAMYSSQFSPYILAASMCAAASVSFCLRNDPTNVIRKESLSVSARVVLSLFVVALMILGAVSLRLPGTSELYVMFAMTFFIASTILHSVLNALFGPPTALRDKSTADFAMPRDSLCDDTRSLLGRDEFFGVVDAAKVYTGRVILVSGAGGSIGSELARQLLDTRPSKIVLFELNEGALYQVHQILERAARGTNIEIAPVLGSVTDERKVRATLRHHRVQVVLHAAAYKHVPLVERNALAGLHNNVEGTHTLATQSILAGVERFVLISSDKAVRPINVMGASKRLCELVLQDIATRLNQSHQPVFSIVRFGNVLGSSGSVLPLFQDQVRRGGPVTVTHPDVSRYFMTAQEAVHLVLQSGTLARGGETFVLEMGEPVNIETLARQVIQNAGLSARDPSNPAGDIELKYVGLRRGEKLSEELTFSGKWAATANPKIYTAIEEKLAEFEVASALRAMRHALSNEDEDGARENACRWVEGPNSNTIDASGLLERENAVGIDLYISRQPQRRKRAKAGKS